MVQTTENSESEQEQATEIVRRPDGTFPKGVSGNPHGRPKGSKNQITLLRQSLELALREQAATNIRDVLDKAMELALEGHPGMIKLLLELHMSKASAEEKDAKEKVSINITGTQPFPVTSGTVINHEDIENDGQTSTTPEGSGHEVQADEKPD